jgi:hypothetical protein
MDFKQLTIEKAQKQVPTVNIELDDFDFDDWGNETAQFQTDDFVVECKDFNIECKIRVTESFRVTHADRVSPSEVNVVSTGLYVDGFRLINDDSEVCQNKDVVQAVYNEFVKSINIR